MIDIDYQVATDNNAIPSEQQCLEWVTLFLSDLHPESELTVRIVDEEESQQLNSEYRGKDKPTNVLSFPFERPEFLPEEIILPSLGDLIICANVVNREAAEQGKTEQAHWAHMLLHGCLHLLGYDHIEDDEAEVMEALEIKILQKMGFPNPYNDQ